MEYGRQISLLLTAVAATTFFIGTNVECMSNGQEAVMRVVFKCLKTDDIGFCLKWKAANALKRLVDTEEPLSLSDYFVLVKKPNSAENWTAGETEGRRSLDLQPGENETVKNEKLNHFIWENLAAFATTRMLQISLPQSTFEGRGSVDKFFKKGHGYFMITMMGSMILKLALAKVAFIAGKALVLAKIALILSLIGGVRRLLGLRNADAELIYGSAEQEANGWQRRLGMDYRRGEHGTRLAYNAYNHAKLNQY